MLAGSIANAKLVNSSVTVAGQSVSLGGSASVSLDNLSDVVITTPATDEIIKYNGTSWVNGASPGGGGGTVTSVTAGTGLSASPASPITTSGTLNVTAAALNPPGAIIMFGSATPPSGWLLCNGQSTTGYTALAAIVGSNVPDLRNRFIVGAGSTYSQGATGGSTSHSHTLSNNGYAKGSRRNNAFVYEEVTPVTTWTSVNEIVGSGGAASFTRTTAIGLGGSTDNNTTYLPPYYALTYIIKT
jgi:microcystin-dependent protein